MGHTFIYLGRERGKRVVHKVGQTTTTCWTRCRHADYLIGAAYEIHFTSTASRTISKQLNAVERFIINYFAERFPVEHGNEYFRTKHYKWEQAKALFCEAMEAYLAEQGLAYDFHEGWVEPYTY